MFRLCSMFCLQCHTFGFDHRHLIWYSFYITQVANANHSKIPVADIYAIIAVSPLYVCVCVYVRELLRDQVHIFMKEAPYT